jgi:hypothetical protein
MLPKQALTAIFGGTPFFVHPQVLVRSVPSLASAPHHRPKPKPFGSPGRATCNTTLSFQFRSTSVQGVVQGLKLLSLATQPAVLFAATDENLNDTTIATQLSTFSEIDDVYSSTFDNILLLQSVGESPSQALLSRINRNQRFNSVYTSVVQSQDELLPSGPYFVVKDGIHQAWRLYPDTLGAFVTTVVPNTVQEPKRHALHGLTRNPLTLS